MNAPVDNLPRLPSRSGTRRASNGHLVDSWLALRVAINVLLATLTVLIALANDTNAQSPPLYQQTPFDRITLSSAHNRQVLKVMTLGLPNRKVPNDPPQNESVTVRLVDKPDQEYQLAWRDIDRIELFESILLTKAEQLYRDRQFDDAYYYYQFLSQEYPDYPQLKSSIEGYWLAEATAAFRKKRYDEAIILLDQVFAQNPTRKNLDKAMTTVYNQVIAAQMKNANYGRARQIVQSLTTKYGDRLAAAQAKWTSELEQIASRELSQAKTALQADNLREAFQFANRSATIWPEVEGVTELLSQLSARYPIARVAVDQISTAGSVRRIDNWAGYRVAKLTTRNLVEFSGVSSEGGSFASELAELQFSADRQNVAIDLTALDEFDGPDGYAFAQRLINATNERSFEYDPALAESLAQVRVDDVFKVQLALHKPHLLMASLLERPVGQAERMQLFRALGDSDEEARFIANTSAPKPSRIREIIERRFPIGLQAVAALERNEVDLVDRIFPAYVPRLQSNSDITVGSYRIPTLHFLVLNYDRPILANRTFRRALAYALNRPTILKDEILAGRDSQGCQVISGPLPIGRSEDDALGYAYDTRIKPRAYDPRVAITLREIALREIGNTDDTSLRILHPPSETARVACQRIQKSLAIIGVPSEVLQTWGEPGDDDSWDMIYKEVAVREPFIDVHRLFGPLGLIRHNSSHLRLALRNLSEADDWESARRRLQRIHKLAHDELVVIPLWQINEHFAYRSLKGVGNDLVGLYQNVQHWTLQP